MDIQGVKVLQGDCLEVVRELPDNSVDAVVTDPPYGLSKQPNMAEVLKHWLNGDDYIHRGGGFMGKTWDSFVPGPSVWKEVFRVLKPGGYAFVFAGSRTSDLMGVSLRLAGFEIRDQIMWVYGSGFPKSLDVSKALDKMAGAERQVISEGNPVKRMIPGADQDKTGSWIKDNGRVYVPQETAAATDAAKRWEGWGTALKPSHEPICLARKPLSEKNVASNVLKHGTGAINVDASRIGFRPNEGSPTAARRKSTFGGVEGERASESEARGKINRRGDPEKYHAERPSEHLGRYPANLIHDGSDEVLSTFPNAKGQQGALRGHNKDRQSPHGVFGKMGPAVDCEPRVDSSESAARFFKECRFDDSLPSEVCYNETSANGGPSWQDRNPIQSTAATAEKILSLRSVAASIVQSVAATWPSLAGIVSSECQGPSTSVTPSEYETICASVITAMTHIGIGFLQESRHEKNTPCDSLVKCVATQDPTGITTITVNLLKSDGFSESATFSITPTSLDRGEAASRFRYCAKASKAERNGSKHPTVKPLALMRYLVRLITPPGGTVLDPFAGSGTTGEAAQLEDMSAILIEREAEYVRDIRQRLKKAPSDSPVNDLFYSQSRATSEVIE